MVSEFDFDGDWAQALNMAPKSDVDNPGGGHSLKKHPPGSTV